MKISRLIKKNTLVEIISGLFILLFVYTALSKLFDYTAFRNVLFKSPLIFNKAGLVAWVLPTIELLVAILLFIPRTRQPGLYASLILMVVFTSYLSYMIYYTPELPCSCGGVLSQMSWKQHLVFNIVFTGLALAGVLLNRQKSKNVIDDEGMTNAAYIPS